jgi:hypothetical protein
MRKEFRLDEEEIEIVMQATIKKFKQLMRRPNPATPSYVNHKPEFFHNPGEIPKTNNQKDLMTKLSL